MKKTFNILEFGIEQCAVKVSTTEFFGLIKSERYIRLSPVLGWMYCNMKSPKFINFLMSRSEALLLYKLLVEEGKIIK